MQIISLIVVCFLLYAHVNFQPTITQFLKTLCNAFLHSNLLGLGHTYPDVFGFESMNEFKTKLQNTE